MNYIKDDFLIKSKVGKKLYLEYAKDMPIYDYHCHLSPEEIYKDKKYKNLTEIWLGGDHYKWRAMRINGVEEKYITGGADDYDKFVEFIKTLEYAVGNPLYQWSHLEMVRYFGITDQLKLENAEKIWKEANEKLKNISARSLIKQAGVTHIGTTDDPTDSLEWHKLIAEDSNFDVKVFPSFRPDISFKIEKDSFLPWLQKLEKVVGYKIESLDDMEKAMISRIEFFHERGSRLADHGFEGFDFIRTNKEDVSKIFLKKLNKKNINEYEIILFRSYMISLYAKEYAKRNWTMQMHIGALRNNNTRMFNKIGADTGFDSMGDFKGAQALNEYFDYLDQNDELPKTIVYNLNSNDNDVFASLMGNFPKEKVPARVAFGTSWWFYDQKDGIEKQMTSMANLALLGRFVGMVTDSRSFLSYTRHEYFRRVACNLIGTWVEENTVPEDYELLGKMVKNICYNNARKYFNM